MWKKYRRLIAAVFYLIALAIPMTPISGTALGYSILLSAAVLALYITGGIIWDASAGIRYQYREKAHRYSKQERLIRFSLLGMFYLVVSLSGLLMYKYYVDHAQTKSDYFMSWGMLAGTETVVVNGRLLSSYASNYRLGAVCFRHFGYEDILDVDNLYKSNLYEIREEDIRIRIPTDRRYLTLIRQ